MPDASWAGPGWTTPNVVFMYLFIYFIDSSIYLFILVQLWRLQQENVYLRQQLDSAAGRACTPVQPSGHDQTRQPGQDWTGTASTGAMLPLGDGLALAGKSGQSHQLGGVSLWPSDNEQEAAAMSVALEPPPSSVSWTA